MKKKARKLSKRQKRNYLITAGIIIILILTVILYAQSVVQKENELLSKNYGITTCKIIKVRRSKGGHTNFVIYQVAGKKYESSGYRTAKNFQLGELFLLKYSQSKPEISQVLYDQPVINDIRNYTEVEGQLISLKTENIWSSRFLAKFTYIYEGEKYDRVLYTQISDTLKVGKIALLINLKNPKISYIKKSLNIKQ